MKRSDRNFVLRAKGKPDVNAQVQMSFWTAPSRDLREIEVLIPPADLPKMAKGTAYSLHPINDNPRYGRKVRDGVTITRD